MKCPQCGNPRIAYNVSQSKRTREERLAGKSTNVRKDFHAKCKKCGWEGEIGNETQDTQMSQV